MLEKIEKLKEQHQTIEKQLKKEHENFKKYCSTKREMSDKWGKKIKPELGFLKK